MRIWIILIKPWSKWENILVEIAEFDLYRMHTQVVLNVESQSKFGNVYYAKMKFSNRESLFYLKEYNRIFSCSDKQSDFNHFIVL